MSIGPDKEVTMALGWAASRQLMDKSQITVDSRAETGEREHSPLRHLWRKHYVLACNQNERNNVTPNLQCELLSTRNVSSAQGKVVGIAGQPPPPASVSPQTSSLVSPGWGATRVPHAWPSKSYSHLDMGVLSIGSQKPLHI